MEFVRRHRILLTSGGLLLVSLLVFSVSVRSRPYRDPIGHVLLDALAPFQVVFSWFGRSLGQVWSGYVGLVDTHQANEQLQARVAALESSLLRLGELEQENARLSELLSFRARMSGTVYGARVIGRDPGPLSLSLTIDRGARDNIRRGMAVLAPQGVVGQVAETSHTAARVVLLTDHNSGVDAIVQRSRARGVVQGGPEGTCYMNYLHRDADVVEGDRIITSGLDGIFPKGIVVGEVVEVARKHRGLLQAAVVRPSVALDQLEEVLVVDATAQVADPAT
ncbi:MAG: rod shape-determining protein MreC [Candidatus Binatia bacterium]